MRELVAVSLAVLISWSPSLQAQPVAHVEDQDVVKGIKQVDDGEYDGAILTLDAATRRLAAQPAKVRDLSQAFLYLGIAYAGKGQEAAARARFREALGQIKDLSLSPESFPPKVINLFEAAKEEVAREAPSAASPAKPTPEPSASAPPAKGGGSGKTLLIVGGIAAVGGGVALAAGGGSKSQPSAAPTPNPLKTEMYTGSLADQQSRTFSVIVSAAGTLDAVATWTETNAVVTMTLQLANPPYTNFGGSNQTTNTSSELKVAVTPTQYTLVVENFSGVTVSAFQVKVTHP